MLCRQIYLLVIAGYCPSSSFASGLSRQAIALLFHWLLIDFWRQLMMSTNGGFWRWTRRKIHGSLCAARGTTQRLQYITDSFVGLVKCYYLRPSAPKRRWSHNQPLHTDSTRVWPLQWLLYYEYKLNKRTFDFRQLCQRAHASPREWESLCQEIPEWNYPTSTTSELHHGYRPYRLWSRISAEQIKQSTIGKRRYDLRFFPRLVKKIGELKITVTFDLWP